MQHLQMLPLFYLNTKKNSDNYSSRKHKNTLTKYTPQCIYVAMFEAFDIANVAQENLSELH